MEEDPDEYFEPEDDEAGDNFEDQEEEKDNFEDQEETDFMNEFKAFERTTLVRPGQLLGTEKNNRPIGLTDLEVFNLSIDQNINLLKSEALLTFPGNDVKNILN